MPKKQTEAKQPKEVVVKSTDPYLYFKVVGRWTRPILGVSPARPTMPDHLAKMLEDEEAKIARAARRLRASEAICADLSLPPEANTEGAETEAEERIALTVASQRRIWLEKALEDSALDEDAKRVIREALRELSVPEKLNRALMRATNTFPRSRNGTRNFIVPAGWFYGALKVALVMDLNLYREQTQEIVRSITIIPDELDLGTAMEDAVKEANVPLPHVRPGEAQATIKRFHMIEPAKHGREMFTIVVRVLDAAKLQEFAKNARRIFTVVGSGGLGGDRQNYGKFETLECEQLEPKEAHDLIAELTA